MIFFWKKDHDLGFGLELRAPWSDFDLVELFEKPLPSTFTKNESFLIFHDSRKNGSGDTILKYCQTPHFASRIHISFWKHTEWSVVRCPRSAFRVEFREFFRVYQQNRCVASEDLKSALCEPHFDGCAQISILLTVTGNPALLELPAGSGRPLADFQSSQFTLMGAGECKSNSA